MCLGLIDRQSGLVAVGLILLLILSFCDWTLLYWLCIEISTTNGKRLHYVHIETPRNTNRRANVGYTLILCSLRCRLPKWFKSVLKHVNGEYNQKHSEINVKRKRLKNELNYDIIHFV